MKKLVRDERVRRIVETAQGDELIVEARAEGLYLRAKGTRTTYGPLSWSSLYFDGASRHAEQRRRGKKKAKNMSTRKLRAPKLVVGI